MATLAFSALVLVAYTYVGYPLLVALWARVAPLSPRGSDAFEPTVSVCVAVHNGAAHLAEKLRSLRALEYPPHKLEFLVCSDGSTDGTERIAAELAAADPRIRVIVGPRRLGKPTALNRLSAAARGEVLLLSDVRQPLAPRAVRALLRPLADPSVGCVSGSLVITGSTGASAYWRYERFIRGSEARLGSMVGVSGSIYAVRREDMPALPGNVLLDDVFVPMRVARAGKSIVLAESAEAYDRACGDGEEFFRKVRTLAGNYQLVALMPWLLVPGKNPVWFQLLSHKLLRLVCPWALVAVLVASTALACRSELPPAQLALWRTLVSVQAMFYGLAAFGARAGRLGALARTFLVLNAAAVVGLWRYLRRSQLVTW